MSSIKAPEVKVLQLTDIKPYWNNPRTITAEAVAAVKSSIQKYGYQQPIVVDKDNVIVVGHTRHRALTELGVKEIEVYVSQLSDEKVREYRLVDNKTGEMADWDHQALVLELREFEEELLNEFFPDVDLEVKAIKDMMVTQEDVDKATKKATTVKEMPTIHTTQIICPSCFHGFQVRTDSLPGVTRGDMTKFVAEKDAELAAAENGGAE